VGCNDKLLMFLRFISCFFNLRLGSPGPCAALLQKVAPVLRGLPKKSKRKTHARKNKREAKNGTERADSRLKGLRLRTTEGS